MKTHSTFGKALIIAFISLIAVSAASAKGKKYGLFVGINAYQGGINPLKGCGQQRGRSFGRGQFAVGRAICPREQPLAGRFRIDPKSAGRMGIAGDAPLLFAPSQHGHRPRRSGKRATRGHHGHAASRSTTPEQAEAAERRIAPSNRRSGER